jgi:hypothetical protein
MVLIPLPPSVRSLAALTHRIAASPDVERAARLRACSLAA